MRAIRYALPLMLGACAGGEPVDSALPAGAPTWHQDVHPILHGGCVNCHQAGSIADRRPWTTYEETQPYAAVIAAEAGNRTMPPFMAQGTDDCPERFPFMHDPRLSEAEIATLVAWSAAGAPEGDPATAAPLPEPEPLHLADYDVEVAPVSGYDMPHGDVSICWSIDPGNTEAKWLEAIEVVPGDLRVTHHIQLQVHDNALTDNLAGPQGWWECSGVGSLGGTDYAGWLPGTRPVEMPPGVAVELPVGGRISMQIHYHNVYDETIFDQTKLRLRYGDGSAQYVEPQIFRVGNFDTAAEGLLPGPNDAGAPEFLIPAGATGHTEEMLFTVPGEPGNEWYAFMLTNHMHQVGTDMRMWVLHDPMTKEPEEPVEECLLATPVWDFGWQAFFYYDATTGQAPIVRQGDQIRILCEFDNSTGNQDWMEALTSEGLPQVPFDVYFGESSLDEMCLAMVGVLDKSDMDAMRSGGTSPE